MKRKLVAIIVPTQKTHFTKDDRTSMDLLNRNLFNFDKYLVVPKTSNPKKLNQPNIHIERFPDCYFNSTNTYNQLMLSINFYKRFIRYKYILIYQPDALVFSNCLERWCAKNFDYIGAPSFFSFRGLISHANGRPLYLLNGGLSLRKVSSFIYILRKAGQYASTYQYNEDGFWSFEAPKYFSKYKLPSFKTALSFSFEKHPRISYFINKNSLPFGSHAWQKYDRSFWLPYLKLPTNP